MEEKIVESVEPKLDKLGRSYGTGRRKTSVARVWFKKTDSGSQSITINGKSWDKYLQHFGNRRVKSFISPVESCFGSEAPCEIKATVKGGGLTGQVDALKHGLSRAIVGFDYEMRAILKKLKFLTRDPRKVERKKFGFHKARKQPQFRKR